MFNNLLMFWIIFFISLVVIKLAMFISKKNKVEMEKMSPFECGFDPISSTRLPFSIRFYMITIIFLIFDVEIALLIPMVKTFFYSNFFFWMFTSIFFLIILIIGIYYEWYQGVLEWN